MGSLVSAIAIGAPGGESWDVSYALRQLTPMLVAESEQGGKDFGELVRMRKQKFGITVAQQEKILPFRQYISTQPDPAELDVEPQTDDPYTRAWWRKEHAERRMAEVLDAIDQAQRVGMTEKQIADLKAIYLHEVESHFSALESLKL